MPNLWYVELTYLNTGAATQHFTCTGWTDPGKARQYLYRGAYWRRGPVTMSAIAAVDTALWDIKG